MTKTILIKVSRLFIAVSFALALASCGGGGGDSSSSSNPPFTPSNPPAAPINVVVVSGDSEGASTANTISWTLVAAATSYTVYWDNAPGVTASSSVVVPTASGRNYVIHSGADVLAGNDYYYRVQAVSADGESVLSGEVRGTPQAAVTNNQLSDVAWNGMDTLVAIGDSGVILRSANATTDAWVDASVPAVPESLGGVTWEGVNAQFAIVGAGSTILTGDGTSWVQEDLSNIPGSINLRDIAWLGDRYIAVGNNGAVVTSNIDGSLWTSQDADPADANTAFNAVGSNGSIIVIVGSNGTILDSDDGVTWNEQAKPLNNDLNDITWDDTQFTVVGSNDTVLTSPDGLTWTRHIPGTSDINFVAVTQWDSGLPAVPLLATSGSSGTFVVEPDADPGTIIPTGTTRMLSGMTWVDDGSGASYFVMVGNDGTVLTARY